MMSELVLWPDPRLSQVCEEVPKGSGCDEIIDDMLDVMREHRGLGISAPQIGSMYRIIIVEDLIMINPTIKHASAKMRWVDEGCLSFPETCPKYAQDMSILRDGKRVRVRRHKWISMRAFDRDWNDFTVKGRDWKGACMQHELEHLDGITLYDHKKKA